MQTRALKTFVEVSRIGSFAKAAERLNMTLSALSMQMKALETELGADLFDRSVRPPRLTPIGRSIVKDASAILEREDALLELCKPIDAITGTYQIGFVTTAAARLLPGFLRNAQRDAPLARFVFETGLSRTFQDKVLSGRLDAAVITDADGLTNTISQHVLREEPFVFAANKVLLKDGLQHLIAQGTFFHFMPDTGIGKLIATEMREHNRPESANTIVLDNLEAIMGCVVSGLGYTLLPIPDVERYKQPSVTVLPAPGTRKRRLILAIADESPLRKREKMFASLFDTATGIKTP